jgi:8-oxo-dGTP pyrophosphatase MutT (NUDIX family)
VTERQVAGLRARLARPAVRDPRLDRFAGYRPAGVLVPLLVDESGAHLLFTVRSHELPHHPGQISFPGGGCRPGEAPDAAARREAYEEVGLDVPAEALLGRLSELPSPARYLATPYVAVLPRPAALRIDRREVAEAFTVPVRDLLAGEPEREVRTLEGATRTLYRYRWREREIWGFTGTVVRELLTIVREARGAA